MLPTSTSGQGAIVNNVTNSTTYVLNINSTGCVLTSANIFLNCAYSCSFDFQFMAAPYVYATHGFMGQWIMAGTWNPLFNRMQTPFKVNKTVIGGPNLLTWSNGTYFKTHNDTTPANQGDHTYHSSGMSFYANVGYNEIINWKVSNLSGGVAYNDLPIDYGWYKDYNNPVHYLDGMTRFYHTGAPEGGAWTHNADWSKTTVTMKSPVYYITSGEPDSYIATLFYGYTGPQTVPTTTAGRYDISWQSPSNVVGSIEIKYSTSDMKVNGFSSGTAGESVALWNQSESGYLWSSPDVTPQPANFYIGLRPHMGIGWVATAPSGDIMVSTGNPLLTVGTGGNITDPWMAAGSNVNVANVAGCTNANLGSDGLGDGNWSNISVLDRGSFSTIDGRLTQIVVTGSAGAAVATTSIAHGLTVGRMVKDFNWNVGFMAAAPVTSVIDSYNFGFTWATGVGTYAPAGTYNASTDPWGNILYFSQAVVLTGSGPCNASYTQPANWDGSYPQLVSTDDKTNFTEIQISAQASSATPSSVVGGRMVGGGVH
jgi:hypothetical protein